MSSRLWKTVSLLVAVTTAAAIVVAVVRGRGPEATARSVAGASAALPFDLPATTKLRASSRKVFAHYFTPYPVSLDNKAAGGDYYARNYLNPAGESGKHRAYGGLLRDRPRPRRVLNGNWQLADMRAEVRMAVAAGLDGFTVDLLNLDPASAHRRRVDLLIRAARQVDPGFKIVLMPDMTASQITSYDPAGLAAQLAALARSPSVHRLGDGRLVVSPFKAESKPAGWYASLIKTMRQRHGIKVAFVPVFLNFGANLRAYSSISYGFSNWGNRSPNQQGGVPGDISKAHRLGKIWMQPVAAQDERPNQSIYDEANNTANLRVTWRKAISGGADWVQLTTWNDFSEGTQITPSKHSNGAYLDLCSYYLTWLKTGKAPAIRRDAVYLSHRTQFSGVRPARGGQTKFMVPRPGTSTPRDRVEVLSFLTAPATIRASIGGAGRPYAAPAGVQVRLFPLRYGTNAASVIRNGRTMTSVTSPFAVTATPNVQDLQYSITSSLRPAR